VLPLPPQVAALNPSDPDYSAKLARVWPCPPLPPPHLCFALLPCLPAMPAPGPRFPFPLRRQQRPPAPLRLTALSPQPAQRPAHSLCIAVVQIPKPALPGGGLKLPELSPGLRQKVRAAASSAMQPRRCPLTPAWCSPGGRAVRQPCMLA
jgi:hypothetical protein